MQNNNNCKNSIVIVLCLSIIILLGFSNAEAEFIIPSTAEELKYQRMVTFYYSNFPHANPVLLQSRQARAAESIRRQLGAEESAGNWQADGHRTAG